MANETLKTALNSLPCTIGELALDLLIQEDESLVNRVTQYPVEDGSQASDHIVIEPGRLTITGMVTNAPIRAHPGDTDARARVTRQGEDQLVGTDINFAELAIEYLRKIRNDKTPVAVVTKRGRWDNMVVERFDRSKSAATGDALVFTISMIELRKVKLLFVAAPRKRTKSARAQPRVDAGKKNTAKGKTEYSSIGYKLNDGIKQFFSKVVAQ
jgi:hypothetical protein